MEVSYIGRTLIPDQLKVNTTNFNIFAADHQQYVFWLLGAKQHYVRYINFVCVMQCPA